MAKNNIFWATILRLQVPKRNELCFKILVGSLDTVNCEVMCVLWYGIEDVMGTHEEPDSCRVRRVVRELSREDDLWAYWGLKDE